MSGIKISSEILRKCSLCGYCEINCPTFLKSRDLLKGPRWRVQGTSLLSQNKLYPDERIVESLYTCLTCAACTLKCPIGLNIPEAVLTGRSMVATKDNFPLSQNKFILSHVKKYKNPLGLSTKAEWADRLGIPSEGDTIFFVGCLYPFIDKIRLFLELSSKLGMKKLAFMGSLLSKMGLSRLLNPLNKVENNRLFKIGYVLKKLGYNFAYLRDEPCCGEVLYNMGYLKEFETYASHFAEYIRDRGVKTIITLSPFCAYTLKEIYPKIIDDWDIEVITLVEALYAKFQGSSLDKEMKLTYHDPCYYSRYLNIFEEPRKILSRIKGAELIEPEHYGKNTLCVGDGGLELYYPEIAYDIAKKRVDELLGTSAKIIVTQCPGCIAMIEWVLKRDKKDKKIKVMDIGEIVYESI